jgi:hypothetical protein
MTHYVTMEEIIAILIGMCSHRDGSAGYKCSC